MWPWCSRPVRRFYNPPSYPELADEEASVLQAHVALLLDDLLDGLEDVSSHRDVSAHIDVPPLLAQALVHRLRQLLPQNVLDVFLTERQRRSDEHEESSVRKVGKETGDRRGGKTEN